MNGKKEQENICFIDTNDCGNYEMAKELNENIVLFSEHDYEAGVLKITISLHALHMLAKEQRKEIIMAYLADLIQKES